MQLKMPSLSPTMTEGTIVKWYKKEGKTSFEIPNYASLNAKSKQTDTILQKKETKFNRVTCFSRFRPIKLWFHLRQKKKEYWPK